MRRRDTWAAIWWTGAGWVGSGAALARTPGGPVAYDPSRDALYRPELGETVLRMVQPLDFTPLGVEAARLAYIRAEASPEQAQRMAAALAQAGFARPRTFADARTGSQAFAAWRESDATALIAFRGTQVDAFRDLLADVSILPVRWSEGRGYVHGGFAAAARSLLPALREWLDAAAPRRARLLLAGHSLGGALATLAASVLPGPVRLVTIGSPRVGNAEFAATVAGPQHERIVNCCDIVTRLPLASPLYTHAGTLRYIDRDGRVDASTTEARIAEDGRLARADYTERFAGRPGAVLVRDLADHAPVNYVRAFFG